MSRLKKRFWAPSFSVSTRTESAPATVPATSRKLQPFRGRPRKAKAESETPKPVDPTPAPSDPTA